MHGRRRPSAIFILGLLQLCAVGGLASLLGPRPIMAVAAPVTVGGPFALTTSDGATVTDRTYRGKWLIVYFGYSFCPDVCPTVLGEIADALTRLGPDAAKVQPIFITVDPARDTPAMLGKYLRNFDPRIVGLTGTPQQIGAVAKEYGVYYVPRKSGADDKNYVVDHSSYIYVMTPDDKFARGFAADASGQLIAEGMHKLLGHGS
jgi:protein SCO1/2